jgi:hypothetical protein
MDVREGDVVALLNPRVLRPFQVSFAALVDHYHLIYALSVQTRLIRHQSWQ